MRSAIVASVSSLRGIERAPSRIEELLNQLNAIYEKRSLFSQSRIDELRSRVAVLGIEEALPGLTVFCAGSYARSEASEHSDIDLFFLHPDRSALDKPRTGELQVFGKLIDVANEMGFPNFSNDCEYLEVHSVKEIKDHLGSRYDDHLNFFTMRMLMLLESQCVFGEQAYLNIKSEFIESYYRDYPDHQISFEPTFLLNDISRFWKTMLLNYENKRKQQGSEEEKIKAKVRNFKLKYSRMTTCFATVAALGCHDTPVTREDVEALVRLMPRQRIELVSERMPELGDAVSSVLEAYAWFLEQTALTVTELFALFEDKVKRTYMFAEADKYRGLMLDLLQKLDTHDGKLIRTLVI